ncbi:MAG: hypothetical protein GY943_13435 [Chloroflexi bacterium]|nr:hypothetical protein [Chloroflexota bacterium]
MTQDNVCFPMIQQSPDVTEAYDTTTPQFDAYIHDIAQWYQGIQLPYHHLDQEAKRLGESALGFRIALKISESWRIIREINVPVTITLLNPVYKETERMLSREEHPHGEDSIRNKIRILRHLETLNDNFEARLVIIDDEDPNGSGVMAAEILQEFEDINENQKYRVLFLKDAIKEQDPAVPPNLTHKSGSNPSIKGGAMLYGMREVIDDDVNGTHILIDNDADLSIHPAQIGLLIADIIQGKAGVVAGSRRELDSVALIGGSRNTRGRLFIQIWQHFLPQLAQTIADTNRAFKAFSVDSLRKFLDDIQIYTFPYQIEVLQASLFHGVPLSKCGIAYVDSEAASTQQGENITETYLNQVRQIIDISQRYHTIDVNDGLLQMFLNISEEEWREIEQNPPDNLSELLLS